MNAEPWHPAVKDEYTMGIMELVGNTIFMFIRVIKPIIRPYTELPTFLERFVLV